MSSDLKSSLIPEKNRVKVDQSVSLLHEIYVHHGLLESKTRLLIYIALVIVYIGINFGLLAGNFVSQETIEENYQLMFHMTSFWTVFIFTTFEAYILVQIDLVNVSQVAQTALLLVNILLTLLVAILFTLSPELYEVVAHYLEYIAQVFISMVDFFFIVKYIREQRRQNNPAINDDHDDDDIDQANEQNGQQPRPWLAKFASFQGVLALGALLLAILQLFIYSGVLPVTIESERAAHFCEFINQIVNGTFALWYATLLFKSAKKDLTQSKDRMNSMIHYV